MTNNEIRKVAIDISHHLKIVEHAEAALNLLPERKSYFTHDSAYEDETDYWTSRRQKAYDDLKAILFENGPVRKASPEKVHLKDLRLGDVVLLDHHGCAYNYCTVQKVTNDNVTFFRPYTHADDEVWTASGELGSGTKIFCYVGIETFDIPACKDETYNVVYRVKKSKP